MIVTFADGTTRQMPFVPSNCTGYACSSIELEADDVVAMRRLAAQDPEHFRTTMLQLEARFPSRRAPGSPERLNLVREAIEGPGRQAGA